MDETKKIPLHISLLPGNGHNELNPNVFCPAPARVASSPRPCLGKTGRRATRRTGFHVEC